MKLNPTLLPPVPGVDNPIVPSLQGVSLFLAAVEICPVSFRRQWATTAAATQQCQFFSPAPVRDSCHCSPKLRTSPNADRQMSGGSNHLKRLTLTYFHPTATGSVGETSGGFHPGCSLESPRKSGKVLMPGFHPQGLSFQLVWGTACIFGSFYNFICLFIFRLWLTYNITLILGVHLRDLPFICLTK